MAGVRDEKFKETHFPLLMVNKSTYSLLGMVPLAVNGQEVARQPALNWLREIPNAALTAWKVWKKTFVTTDC